MFLNTGILKRLMKQAYKGGLSIARTEEKVYLAGSYWEFEILERFLPKQIRTQIIELAGELPEVGERFSATKEGNQMEAGYNLEILDDSEKLMEVSDVIIDNRGKAERLLQNWEGKIFLVDNVFTAIADNSGTDYNNGEYDINVREPYYDSRGIYWKNNVCKFHAWFLDDERHQLIINKMEMINLMETEENAEQSE